MTQAVIEPNSFVVKFSPVMTKCLTATALVLSADFLFYGHALGLSILVFCCLLSFAAILNNSVTAALTSKIAAGLALVLSLLPILENCSILSVLFASLGTASFALTMTTSIAGAVPSQLYRAARLLMSGPVQLIMDISEPAPAVEVGAGSMSWSRAAMGWILPIVFGSIFITLFVSANPVFETWIPIIDLSAILAQLTVSRALFWIVALNVTWSFVSVRSSAPKVRGVEPGPGWLAHSEVFSHVAVLRSLLVFNAVFALQTLSDMNFLWGGATLPNGMTYATYAHRGAYPLMVTALLAYGFVLATLRPGSASEQSKAMRALVLFWIAQNVMLVISSIMRLELYVGGYSLTHWRVAAFIWMGLVAIGLVWLIVRIFGRWSNAWLLSANCLTALIVLYACCFLNFPRLIAQFNVAHMQHVGENCVGGDMDYFWQLGPEVIPVLDDLKKTSPDCFENKFKGWRYTLSKNTLDLSDWRSWSFRLWRLRQYLLQHEKDNDSLVP